MTEGSDPTFLKDSLSSKQEEIDILKEYVKLLECDIRSLIIQICEELPSNVISEKGCRHLSQLLKLLHSNASIIFNLLDNHVTPIILKANRIRAFRKSWESTEKISDKNEHLPSVKRNQISRDDSLLKKIAVNEEKTLDNNNNDEAIIDENPQQSLWTSDKNKEKSDLSSSRKRSRSLDENKLGEKNVSFAKNDSDVVKTYSSVRRRGWLVAEALNELLPKSLGFGSTIFRSKIDLINEFRYNLTDLRTANSDSLPNRTKNTDAGLKRVVDRVRSVFQLDKSVNPDSKIQIFFVNSRGHISYDFDSLLTFVKSDWCAPECFAAAIALAVSSSLPRPSQLSSASSSPPSPPPSQPCQPPSPSASTFRLLRVTVDSIDRSTDVSPWSSPRNQIFRDITVIAEQAREFFSWRSTALEPLASATAAAIADILCDENNVLNGDNLSLDLKGEGKKKEAKLDLCYCEGGMALEDLLYWLSSYRSLFTKPCMNSKALLLWDFSSHPLPPIFRPFKLLREELRHLACHSDMAAALHLETAPENSMEWRPKQ
eukprot:CAMPEP_0175056108 /NCGR_PEP_ID=MMETSP0052_2-20121109/10476_1 /TAXON_ID=51329 ORGANISM="Polytomella parva, Strain SAG 63-3" /NCGR_SAMPLE_ID=MMETSP0052_2 /ASSEMBLY_ACC=CAM_ASM_000194 /LENGTH=542 /DNA_ID=CAMNT_0016321075 /DNA_START=133 /DNA_END=1760 /DNA_ORIENTATION=-